MSVASNIAEGPRAALEAVRDQLASRLDDPDTPASAIAALSKEFRQVVQLLESSAEVEVDPIDALAARRAARLAEADPPASAAPRSQPRKRKGSQRAG